MDKEFENMKRYLTQSVMRTGMPGKLSPFLAGVGCAALLIAITPCSAVALNLYDGSQSGNNLEINLTTTVSYSGFLRVNSPSAILEGPGNANGNDGDSNFQHGLVGNQFEVLPILDIRDGNFGLHFSGEAFLNTVYLKRNQNGQPGTFNSIYSTSNQNFTSGTRNVNGQNAKLLDAFAVAKHDFSDGQEVEFKFGRQTLFWGQSLLFANNGISAGQAPIDVITAQDTPNAESQQVFLPVGQAVFTYRPNIGDLVFQGYYQFEWAHDAFQGAGAYFNSADYINAGGQSVIAGYLPGVGNEYFLRAKDLSPEHQNGQFGISVQDTIDQIDLGLYALRWDAKQPEIYAFPGRGGVMPVAGGLAVGQYQVVYPRDIHTYGASFSTNIGASNVGGEISARTNMPLIPSGFGIPSPGNPGNANSDPLYPVGNLLYSQVSMLYSSPGLAMDPGGVTVTAEAAGNHLIHVTENREALVIGHQATAAAVYIIVSPEYFNVLPGLNLQFPVGLDYGVLGRSQVDASMYHGVGTFNVGVTATYRQTWVASIVYQDYLGKPDPSYNGDADRGYVSLTLSKTF